MRCKHFLAHTLASKPGEVIALAQGGHFYEV